MFFDFFQASWSCANPRFSVSFAGNEEAVSPESESLRVLKNTLVCDSSKVENDAVGEEEATQRASEAAMQYAARQFYIFQCLNAAKKWPSNFWLVTLQCNSHNAILHISMNAANMRPRVPRASSTLSVHGWTEFTEPATPAFCPVKPERVGN